MVVHPLRVLALGLVLAAAPAVLQAAEGGAQPTPSPAQKGAVASQKAAPLSPAQKPGAKPKPPQVVQPPAAPQAPAAPDETQEQPDPATGRKGAFAPTTWTNPKTGRRVIVITNEDLERMYGPSSPSDPAAAGAASEGEAAAAPEVRGEATEDASAAADPAARAAAIQEELKRLQQKERHIKNPFLPAPTDSEAERSAEKGLGAIQRLQQTQERMNQLSEELRQLQEKQQQQAGGGSPAPSGQ